MRRYEEARDDLRDGKLVYRHLDACQLLKHAFGLRSQIQRETPSERTPVLFYLYAEPSRWSDGRSLQQADFEQHRDEIQDFSARIAGDEVAFLSCDYHALLDTWRLAGGDLAEHADRVLARFAPAPLDA